MFQTKVVEKIKTHILCSTTFFRKSCPLWHNVEKYCRAGQATDDNMAHGMLDTGATDIDSEYVILIAFPVQQYLYESAWMLRYAYIVCLVRSCPSPGQELPSFYGTQRL